MLPSLSRSVDAGTIPDLINEYNLTGIRSPEDPLDFDPIQATPLLAVNVWRDRLDIWNATTETLTMSLYTARIIRDVISSPDGLRVAIVGSDNQTSRHTIAVYDTMTWMDTFTGTESPTGWSIDGAWSSDGKWFAAGSQDGKVYIYDTSDWRKLFNLQGPDVAEVTEVEFSSDRTMLAAVIGNQLWVFNLTTRQEVWSNQSGDGTARWMPGTHKLLQNQNDIVDGDDGWKLIRRVDGFFGRFHPSGKYLAMGGGQDLIIYNTHDWIEYQQKIFSTDFTDLKWGMDGDVLYTYGDSSTIRCWIVVGGALDDRPPTVDVTFPSEGGSLEDRAYAFGDADDDHGVQYVFLKVDDDPWQLASGTVSWSWIDISGSVQPGAHTLHVRAFDGRFYSATAIVNFTLTRIPVPNRPPRLNILSPQDGDTVQGRFQLIARAEDENGTLVYIVGIDNEPLLNFSDSLVWNRTLDFSGISAGRHRISARAFDGAVWSDPVTVTVQVRIPPEADARPIVSIARPTNLEIVFGNVTVSGSVFDDHSVDFVVLEADGRELVMIPDAWEWSFVWDSSTLEDGYHNITAWAWDGHQRSGDTTVMLLVRQPVNYFKNVRVAILKPLPGQQISDDAMVSVDVVSEPIGYFPERIWLRVDQLSALSAVANANNSIVFDTHLVENGYHDFHVWVTGYGLTSSEAEVRITVLNSFQNPNDPPTLQVEFPWQDALIRGSVECKGTSADDHGLVAVFLRVDDDPWKRLEGGASWSYLWDSTTVPDGAHRISVRSFDGEKYSSEASIEILVDNVPESTYFHDGSIYSMVLFVVVLSLAIILAYTLVRHRAKT